MGYATKSHEQALTLSQFHKLRFKPLLQFVEGSEPLDDLVDQST